jgi:hypothetical protein
MSDYTQAVMFGVPAPPCLETVGTQGAKANRAGGTAEATIYCIFKERHYSVRRQVKIGQGIYGTDLRADFLISGLPGFPDGLIIESKWQASTGSVDEKFPYVVSNIRAGKYPCPVIVVLDGGGYKDGAEQWLRSQVDGYKFYAVFSFAELIKWVIESNF